MGTPIELQSVPFASIDVATTGFSPWLKDRVIEIAIVRFDLSDGIRDEFCTLVNPHRDVGRTDIHGPRRCCHPPSLDRCMDASQVPALERPATGRDEGMPR